MNPKEAKSRIKINKLLEESGWRFFDNEVGPANIQLENNVKLRQKQVDEFGEDFDKTQNGFIDFDLPLVMVPMHKLVSIIKHWHIDEGSLPPVPEVENLTNYAV